MNAGRRSILDYFNLLLSAIFCKSNIINLEVVSKPQIRSKGKAQADRESAAYNGYVSICRRPATQPLGLRWGFETTSRQNACIQRDKTILLIKILREQFGGGGWRPPPRRQVVQYIGIAYINPASL